LLIQTSSVNSAVNNSAVQPDTKVTTLKFIIKRKHYITMSAMPNTIRMFRPMKGRQEQSQPVQSVGGQRERQLPQHQHLRLLRRVREKDSEDVLVQHERPHPRQEKHDMSVPAQSVRAVVRCQMRHLRETRMEEHLPKPQVIRPLAELHEKLDVRLAHPPRGEVHLRPRKT
jgi:hypothetical protein